MLELLSYPFFMRALIATVVASVLCGVIGTYVVSRRIVFISGGITHASFGGIGIGYYLGWDPIAGAALFSVAAAFAVEYFSRGRSARLREDTVIGILWSFGMATGVIFAYLTPGYAPNLSSYLFGSVFTVSWFYLAVMGALCAFVLIFFFAFFKEILYIAFDEEYARIQGVPARGISYALMGLIALTIVVSIRVVGVILVISLLSIPQATAGIFTRDFRRMIPLSVIFALIACVAGLYASDWLRIPSGACIIFSSVIVYGVLKIASVAKFRFSH